MRVIGWILCAAAVTSCAAIPPPVAEAPPPPVAAAAPEPAPVPPAPLPPPPAPTPAPEPPVVEAPPPAPAPEKAPAEVLFVGTVTFPDGTKPRAVILTLGREGMRPLVVFGKNGRFEKRVPEEGTYFLAGLIADGVMHAYLPHDVVIEDGKEVRFLLEEKRPAALLVLDAETGAPLPGARGLRSIQIFSFEYLEPYPRFRKGETETLRADGNGRIDLGEGRGKDKVWVVAKGHAWTPILVPHTPGGDVPVRLPPGGSLRLQVPGWSDLENASLYMEFESRSSCLMPDPKASGEILLEGLPCETLSFEVRRGGPPSEAPPLGKGTVSIRAGEEAALTLTMRAGPPPARAVRVRGTVDFHPAWGDPEGTIRFEGAEDANADIQEMVDLHGTSTIGHRTFVLSRLVPGRYRVEVDQWRTEVTVPAAGGNFDFAIPEPAEIRVRVVAEESGEILRGAEVSWHIHEKDLHSWSSESATPDRATGEFVVHCLPGALSMTASAPGRVERSNADPDHDEKGTPEYPTYAAGEKATVTLRLVRGGGVRVRLRCDGAPVPDSGLTVMVGAGPGHRSFGSGCSAFSISRKGEVYATDAVEPGRRTISVEDEKDLFEEVPETAVEIVAGETAEVTIDLVRRAPRVEAPSEEGILRVLDEETGQPIPGATVSHVIEKASGRSWRYKPLPKGAKPGEFLFRGPPGINYFHADAPGHVSLEGHPGAPVEVLAGQPMEHEFRLSRAGSVLVTFRGGGSSFRPKSVWLRKDGPGPSGWSSKSLSVTGSFAREDGLSPGTYTLQVKPGEGFEPGPDPEVVIRAGETTEVVVDISVRVPESEATSVRGTVTFHPGWGALVSEVRFLGMEGGNGSIDVTVVLPKADAGRPVPFVVGHLPPGRYRVEVKPQWDTDVEVPEGGGSFDFAIPEPAEVLVRVVADETGKPLAGARVWWYSSHEDRDDPLGFSRSGENTDESPKAGEFRFLVPPGRVDISASAPGRSEASLSYTGEDREYEPPSFRSGEKAERTIRLPLAGKVSVLLRCEGRLLARREVEVWLVRESSGTPRQGAFSWCMNGQGGSLSYDGIPPGSHTLEVRDDEGRFDPVPDRVVEVRGGATTEVTVDLVRKK